MLRNFLFHRVHPQRDRLWDPMDPELFDRCIRYISQHYEVVLFEEWHQQQKKDTKKKMATIMFDDGFQDNIQYAAPILDKHRCKASFYVVTDCIDRNIPTWTFELEYAFQHTRNLNLDLDFSFLPGQHRKLKFHSNEERIGFANDFKKHLKSITHDQRTQVMHCILNQFNDVEQPKVMMRWDEVSQLKSAGHYIGSHTLTHAMLGTMKEETAIRHELKSSGEKIKEKLGYFPETISYPVGSFNETTKQLSRECGYTIGLAVKQQLYDPANEDIMEVSRIELYNEPWWKTRLRITHSLEKIKKLIRYR